MMSMYRYRYRRVLVAVVALLLRKSSTVVVSTDDAVSKYAVDLSYKPHIDLEVILPQLLDKDIVSVDLTGSMLGDDRFINLFDALLGDAVVKHSSLLQLKAQMNRLSATCATRLFQLLCLQQAKPGGTINNEMHLPTSMLELDLGFNPLLVCSDDDTTSRHNPTTDTSDRAQKQFQTALRTFIASKDSCPTDLGLDCTGMEASTCRAIAKGIVQRFATVATEEMPHENLSDQLNDLPRPISLRLARNPGIGDPGVAALAAALRTIVHKRPGVVVLNTLDLSSCNVGDTGAEALAMAFDTASGRNAISRLVIGHNRIGNRGLSAICRAFPPSTLILNGNDQITDSGMRAVADLICGERRKADTFSLPCVSKLSLRSCCLKASGAERIGAALRRLLSTSRQREVSLDIDLSGNPLGILRGKAKTDSKYSASRIKSTVSATANAYMSQGLRLLKKGFGSTVESDDEEEINDGQKSDDEDQDFDQDRCGLKALANAFLFAKDDDVDEDVHQEIVEETPLRTLNLGLRRTFCDTAGAEALAAMMVTAKERFHCSIRFDVSLNPVLDEAIVDALRGENDDILHEMSDHHLETMEILHRAKQKAVLAARATASRLRREYEVELEWGSIDESDSYAANDPSNEKHIDDYADL